MPSFTASQFHYGVFGSICHPDTGHSICVIKTHWKEDTFYSITGRGVIYDPCHLKCTKDHFLVFKPSNDNKHSHLIRNQRDPSTAVDKGEKPGGSNCGSPSFHSIALISHPLRLQLPFTNSLRCPECVKWVF